MDSQSNTIHHENRTRLTSTNRSISSSSHAINTENNNNSTNVHDSSSVSQKLKCSSSFGGMKKLRGILKNRKTSSKEVSFSPSLPLLCSSSAGQINSEKKFSWDESNLEANAIIQEDIMKHNMNNTRIDEPKTPYVSYLPPDEDEQEVDDEKRESKPKVNSEQFDESTAFDLKSPREIETNLNNPQAQMAHLEMAFGKKNDSIKSSGHISSEKSEDGSFSPSSPRFYHHFETKNNNNNESRHSCVDNTTKPSFVPSISFQNKSKQNNEKETKKNKKSIKIVGSPSGNDDNNNSIHDSEGETSEDDAVEKKKHEKFLEKRKHHYNEYLVLKRLRESGKLNDEEEQNEEEDDEMSDLNGTSTDSKESKFMVQDDDDDENINDSHMNM